MGDAKEMPDRARWRRIQELFDTASDWPSPEREARLADLEIDEELRAEVLSLLAASEEESWANTRVPVAPAAATPERIGPYRVLRLAGAGGRGRVYEAVQEIAGTEQRVAVKVMQEHLLAPEDLARFEREQRVLISLDHPWIARFLSAGWDDQQRPYFAMEWVEGEPIDEYCRQPALSLGERIRLVADVLEALQAAHRRLVVHLDLKPSNILVDRRGKVRILDFGTAKLLGERGEEATSTLQLTPRFASPERLRGEPVSTACDIYSVGLVLHQVVTGRWPFEESHSIAALAERAAGTTELRITTGHPDLDAILLQALQHDPNRRYWSAAEFAADLHAFLEKRPVQARKPTLGYRLSRLVARNRIAFATGTLALVAVAGAAVYGIRQQQMHAREATRSREIAGFLRWMITSSSIPGSGRPAMSVVEMVQRGQQRIKKGTTLPDDVAAGIQADFAYLTQEHGREDLAEPMARDAIQRADRSGDAEARLKSRATLSALLLRAGRCAEVMPLVAAGDALLHEAAPSISAVERAVYFSVRSGASERCEAKLADAIRFSEQGLALAGDTAKLHQASLQLNHALLLARAGRHREALAAANRGLTLAAADPDGAYNRVALLRIRSQVYATAGDANAALTDIRDAARLAPGVVNPFEEVRLRTLLAGRLVDAGSPAEAADAAREAVAEARRRAAEIGPSFWMILADAAEVLSKCRACAEAIALYQEAGRLTNGQMPRTWKGNRLFFEAECALPDDPQRAARLAREALDVYGELLPATSKRRQRILELIEQKQ